MGELMRTHARAAFLAICALFLIGLSSTANAETYADFYTLCTSCTTQASFENAALTFWGHRFGDKVVEVANPNSFQTYFVEIDHEFEPPVYAAKPANSQQALTLADDHSAATDHFRKLVSQSNTESPVVIFIKTGTNTDGEIVKSVVGWYKTDVITSAPYAGATVPIGQSSFQQWTQEAVCPALYNADSANPAFTQAYGTNAGKMLSALFSQLIGKSGPVGTFIFSNGDVAQFTLVPENPDVCSYNPGTARNKNGQFINDSGLGGNGGGNGDNYVSSRPPNLEDILWHDYVFECGYVDGQLSRCMWISQF